MKAAFMLVLLSIVLYGCGRSPVGPASRASDNTAGYWVADVNSFVKAYSGGLQLMLIQGTVSPQGTSAEWQYGYINSTEPDSVYVFHATESGIGFDSIMYVPIKPGILPQAWLNSDSVMAIAEENGGSQFRRNNPQCKTTAVIVKPYASDATTYWYVKFYSNTDESNFFQLAVNAGNGNILVMHIPGANEGAPASTDR